jgi:hypothetical protein
MVQHDWVTANPSKVITIQDSLAEKNITAAFANPAIWPFSRLAYKDFEPSSVTPKEKELQNQDISVPSASTPVARGISWTNKDSLSSEDVHPFPKPGPRCVRRQRKKVKSSRILTNSPIKDSTEQEALAREAIKKKYCIGAKNYLMI